MPRRKRLRPLNKTGYREIAFAEQPHKCDECGYNKLPSILEVHHINFDHRDNRSFNLQILCPTCHREVHFMEKMSGEDLSPDPDDEEGGWMDE